MCLTKIEVHKLKQVKTGLKMIDCIFNGYVNNSNVYHFLVYKSKIQDAYEGTIIESRNASLFYNVFHVNIRKMQV